ncbi:hypothetical protein Hanom_Chr02g00155391 [Helianthus anomalus]
MCLYVLFFIFGYEFPGNEELIGLRLWILRSRINRDEGVSSHYHQHKCFGLVKMVQVTKMTKRNVSMFKLFCVVVVILCFMIRIIFSQVMSKGDMVTRNEENVDPRRSKSPEEVVNVNGT